MHPHQLCVAAGRASVSVFALTASHMGGLLQGLFEAAGALSESDRVLVREAVVKGLVKIERPDIAADVLLTPIEEGSAPLPVALDLVSIAAKSLCRPSHAASGGLEKAEALAAAFGLLPATLQQEGAVDDEMVGGADAGPDEAERLVSSAQVLSALAIAWLAEGKVLRAHALLDSIDAPLSLPAYNRLIKSFGRERSLRGSLATAAKMRCRPTTLVWLRATRRVSLQWIG